MNETLQQRIKKVRVNNDLYQRDVARSLCVHCGYISKIERGIINPDLKFLKEMCLIFKLSEKWLLFGEGDMRSNVQNHYGNTNQELLDLVGIIGTIANMPKEIATGIAAKIDPEQDMTEMTIGELLAIRSDTLNELGEPYARQAVEWLGNLPPIVECRDMDCEIRGACPHSSLLLKMKSVNVSVVRMNPVQNVIR